MTIFLDIALRLGTSCRLENLICFRRHTRRKRDPIFLAL